MTFYQFLVLIHVLSAIVGLGPGFIMTVIIKKADTLPELKHGFKLRTRLHTSVMTGGILLLVTGLAMGLLRPYLFSAGWYVISLVLYFIALLFGPFILKPIAAEIKVLLAASEGPFIPEDYGMLASKLHFYENLINLIFIMIIIFMVLKPF